MLIDELAFSGHCPPFSQAIRTIIWLRFVYSQALISGHERRCECGNRRKTCQTSPRYNRHTQERYPARRSAALMCWSYWILNCSHFRTGMLLNNTSGKSKDNLKPDQPISRMVHVHYITGSPINPNDPSGNYRFGSFVSTLE
jgi:hypothetical protein